MLKWIKTIILLLVMLTPLFVTNLYAATIYANSASQSDVANAISRASSGDTVRVPAGSATWSGYVSLNKEIAVFGAGMGQTIITNYGFDVPDGVDNWRISGFEFRNPQHSLQYCIQAGGSKSTNGCRNWRIDNVRIRGYMRFIWTDGHNTGVIDHSEFYGCSVSGIIINSGADDASISDPTGLGSSDFVFIEDNEFFSDGQNFNHIIWTNCRGARVVARYNTVTETNGGRIADPFDIHGFGHDSYGVGTRAYEFYENTFNRNVSSTCCRLFQVRGGTGLIYNNTLNYSGGSSFSYGVFLTDQRAAHVIGFSRYTRSDGCTSTQYPDSSGGEGYPACDQIGRGRNNASEPLYIWGNRDHNNNRLNVGVDSGQYSGNGATGYIRNVAHGGQRYPDFFEESSSFNGTTGIGMGRRADRPTTCTDGVAYWSTDYGVLDKCVSNNNWSNGWYAPYTYPHPLVSGETPPEEASDPSGLIARASQNLPDGDVINGTVNSGEWKYYTVYATSQINTVSVSLINPTGNVRLFVDTDRLPTLNDYTCTRTAASGNNTYTCEVSNTGEKTWIIGVYGDATASYQIQANLQ